MRKAVPLSLNSAHVFGSPAAIMPASANILREAGITVNEQVDSWSVSFSLVREDVTQTASGSPQTSLALLVFPETSARCKVLKTLFVLAASWISF